MNKVELQQCWDRYKNDKNLLDRDRLIEHYYPFVEKIANNLVSKMPQHVDVNDLIGYGAFGLMEAVERYDDYGFKFEVYAGQRIRGEILDNMRKADWVPRGLRGRIRSIERVIEELTVENKKPSIQEIAKHMDIPQEEVQEAISMVHGQSRVSLDELVRTQAEDSDALVVADMIEDASSDHSAQYDMNELMETLSEGISSLPERERTLTILYYFNDYNLGQIGKIMEITEARACQIHTKAMLKLKEYCTGVR